MHDCAAARNNNPQLLLPAVHCSAVLALSPLQPFSEVFPHLLTARDVPPLIKIEDVAWDNVDAGGCCPEL